MATVPLGDFLPEVLPHVSGCSISFAKRAVLNACREFCARTRRHKVFLPGVPILANTPTYTFSGMPAQTEVVIVLHGRLGLTKRMLFKDQDWLEQNLSVGWETLTGTPQYLTQDDEDSFRVVPFSDADLADQVVLRVALQPTLDATDVESHLLTSNKLDIAHGALALLMLTPNVPYSNTALGAAHGQAFRSAIGDTSWQAFKGFTRARPKVRGQYF